MPKPTTQSGQAAAQDLIAMFRQAQQLTARAREQAIRLQHAVDEVLNQADERPGGDGRVCIEIDCRAWEHLRACAQTTQAD